MRLWAVQLLPYLSEAQFKGQLRELVLIMRTWRNTGKTNHLLINRVMEYPKEHLTTYFMEYSSIYHQRYGKPLKKYHDEFCDFCEIAFYPLDNLFKGWHNKEYLRVCMANLYEKHFFGIGKSRITDEEWGTLCRGYKEITGEEYQI